MGSVGKLDEGGISFSINGKPYNVNPETTGDLPLETPLVDFIRDRANLKGTKAMCREGGCGACVVSVTSKDPSTGKETTRAVNSCLTPVLSLRNCEVRTVEGIGSQRDGYHPIQKRLVDFNGTQCGYCSPGMVMSMYSLLESKGEVTVGDVNESFDGNICRCTGYRPILDAFKSFAVDAPKDLLKCGDIEDCNGCPCKPKSGSNGCCKAPAQLCESNGVVNFKVPSGQEWIQPTELGTALDVLHRWCKDGKKYRIVAGNTGTGVFKYDGPYDAYLDVNMIGELKQWNLNGSDEVMMGGNVSLTKALQLFPEGAQLPGYEYMNGLKKHWSRVANVPVRNNGTIAGNLMMKHAHHDFPSDIFLTLETVGAEIRIAEGKPCLKSLLGAPVTSKKYKLLDFLQMDMRGKMIVSVHFPQWKEGYVFRSFKITRRFQNAHAYVNAGFLIRVNPKDNFKVMEKPRILYGGINPTFFHATKTEAFLNGKCLGDINVLHKAMEVMEEEIQPDYHPPDAVPQYRKTLAKNLLYKTILGIMGNRLSGRISSGGKDIQRGISSGKQTHEESKGDHALYQNVKKVEGPAQVSGEAEYVNDIPPRPDELYGAFVLSTVAKADLVSIDPSEALKLDGVVGFVSEKDVPGVNNYMTFMFLPMEADEKIFAKDKTHYAGQSLGVIVAKTQRLAEHAAKLVKVTYANAKKPLLDIGESLKRAEGAGVLDQCFLPILSSGSPKTTESLQYISGEFGIGSQYQFHMETQSCIAVPKEDGEMDIFLATQYMDHAQVVVASALNIPVHKVNVEVRRLGGSFGGKIFKATFLASACAVAAHAMRKPVRMVLPMETNMRMMGLRNPYLSRYRVGFDARGKIGELNIEIFCDPGWSAIEMDTFVAMHHVQNVYEGNSGWTIKPGYLLTDKPSNTACRAPGTTQGVATMEYIMEHIAHTLRKDPLEVRMTNFLTKGDTIVSHSKKLESENLMTRMIQEVKESGNYEERKRIVEAFNRENRWKKRGLSLTPVRYEMEFFPLLQYPVSIVVYHEDGTVAISHGGIEMGQGLNTKVAQTVAHTLNIPMDLIRMKPSNTFSGANAFVTGGSFGSEICCGAAKEAANILLERLNPIRKDLEDKSWKNVIKAAHAANVELLASYTFATTKEKVEEYNIWVVNLTEVEVDLLTGEYKVMRVDLIEDAGKSLSPGVDIGQIEGAYVMGQGLWTTEKIQYDENTGQLLTYNTWEYKPPETLDIPEDFRVSLLANAPNPYGVLRSKATGEPPLVSSVAVFLAIKQAIHEGRTDAGNTNWFHLNGPVTPEDILLHSLTSPNQFAY